MDHEVKHDLNTALELAKIARAAGEARVLTYKMVTAAQRQQQEWEQQQALTLKKGTQE